MPCSLRPIVVGFAGPPSFISSRYKIRGSCWFLVEDSDVL